MTPNPLFSINGDRFSEVRIQCPNCHITQWYVNDYSDLIVCDYCVATIYKVPNLVETR